MDGTRFDALVRSVVTSRRPFSTGILGGVLGALLWQNPKEDAVAKKKKKSKGKKGKNKKKDPGPPPAAPSPPANPTPNTDSRCDPRIGFTCPGCCDGQGRCRDGVGKDGCGIGTFTCAECIATEECTSVGGEMICCVPLGQTCGGLTCCPDSQCQNDRCCAPSEGACFITPDCCEGDCVNGVCCPAGDRACQADDECCGQRPCLKLSTGQTKICCPEERQCGERCCAENGRCEDPETGQCEDECPPDWSFCGILCCPPDPGCHPTNGGCDIGG